MWFGPALGRRGAVAADSVRTRHAPGRRAVARPLARLSARRLVAEPDARRRRRSTCPIRSGFFCDKLSRRTWRYFEVFVTAEENWLPPDNFQEKPTEGIASRTSPTNIGMALLADLAACDFGYCSAGRLLDRIRQDVRHPGPHGAPSRPLLQLVRHAFAQAAFPAVRLDGGQRQPGRPPAGAPQRLARIDRDEVVCRPASLAVCATRLACCWTLPADFTARKRRAVRRWLALTCCTRLERLVKDLENRPDTLSAAATFLQRLVTAAAEIAAAVGADEELQWWASAFERSCTDHRDDLLHIAAWASLSSASGTAPTTRRVSRASGPHWTPRRACAKLPLCSSRCSRRSMRS